MTNYYNLPRIEKSPVITWLAPEITNYFEHILEGMSIRAIARAYNRSPSTILRRIRRIEARRDDILVDEAIEALSAIYVSALPQQQLELRLMPDTGTPSIEICETTIQREARRVLRRLCENKAFLLVSPSMDKAAVFKECVPGRMTRLAVVERDVVRAFAIKDWIECEAKGKLSKYKITTAGRSALKRLIVEEKSNRAAKASSFQKQHQVFGERVIAGNGTDKPETVRYNLAESPLSLLAKKKDKSGAEFLSPELLEAGERLREDFERAHMGPRVAQNWERFLTGVSTPIDSAGGSGNDAARVRVSAALKALGPGLGDIALRVCCYLDGLEKAEKRLGWSARSGKVVLKIALVRLAIHYGLTTEQETRKVG